MLFPFRKSLVLIFSSKQKQHSQFCPFSFFLGMTISSQSGERMSKDLQNTPCPLQPAVFFADPEDGHAQRALYQTWPDLVPLHLSLLIPCASPKDVIWYSTGDRRGNPKSVTSQASFTNPIISRTRSTKYHDNSQLERRAISAPLFCTHPQKQLSIYLITSRQNFQLFAYLEETSKTNIVSFHSSSSDGGFSSIFRWKIPRAITSNQVSFHSL